MAERKELELVTQAAAGNRYSFSLLVETHYEQVYRLCYKYCGVREDAEDVTQDIFVRLGSAIRSFKGDSAFRTWLYRIAMNALHDHFRKHKRRRETAFDESFDAESEDAAADEVVYVKQVVMAVGELPEKIKQAVILVCAEEMTHAEAAAVLGCAEGTVSWRISEAKRLLSGVKQKVKMLFSWLW